MEIYNNHANWIKSGQQFTSTICGNISWPRFRILLISLLHTSNIFTYSVGPLDPNHTYVFYVVAPGRSGDLITQEIRPVESPSD